MIAAAIPGSPLHRGGKDVVRPGTLRRFFVDAGLLAISAGLSVGRESGTYHRNHVYIGDNGDSVVDNTD